MPIYWREPPKPQSVIHPDDGTRTRRPALHFSAHASLELCVPMPLSSFVCEVARTLLFIHRLRSVMEMEDADLLACAPKLEPNQSPIQTTARAHAGLHCTFPL